MKWLPFAVVLISVGCTTPPQDYRVVSDPAVLLAQSGHPNVLDVVCQNASYRHKTCGLWVLAESDAFVDLKVDDVLKGSEQRPRLAMQKYRMPTRNEAAMLSPTNLGTIHNDLRLRIAYSHRSGDRLYNLEIASLGLEPEFEKTYEAWQATTRPK